MTRRRREYTVAAALLCLGMGIARPARAEEQPDPPRLPMMEIGLIIPMSYRAKGFPEANDPANATSVGFAMRIESGVLGLFLRFGGLSIGEYLGLDFGVTNSGDLTGRLAYGFQTTYEINRDVGVGFRVYYMTILEDLLPGNFGSHYDNFITGELSGRFTGIIGRFRFDLAKGSNGGADVRDLGLSVRFPVGWHLMGYSGWQLGVDYDRIDTKDSPGTTDGYVIHRASAVMALAF